MAWLAVESDSLKALRTLIEDYKADCITANHQGVTPLHRACEKTLLNIAKYLIKKGARLDAQDYRGRTPLDLALRKRTPSPYSWTEDRRPNLVKFTKTKLPSGYQLSDAQTEAEAALGREPESKRRTHTCTGKICTCALAEV